MIGHAHLDTLDPALGRSDDAGVCLQRVCEGFDEQVAMLEWSAGFSGSCIWPGGAEYFVLEGAFDGDLGRHGETSWLRLPVGAVQTVAVVKRTGLYRQPVICVIPWGSHAE